jgi:hypothetical protein
MQSESTARTALLSGLIDYAGLFPPESRDMAGAVEGYRDARALQSWMVDQFVCPDDRLEELAGLLADEPDPWPLSVVISAPSGDWSKGIADYARSLAVVELAMRDVARFSVAEIRIPPDLVDKPTLSAILASVRASLGALFSTVLFEVSMSGDWQRFLPLQMRSIFEAKAGAKIRCGGLAIEDFPTPEQVASFIALAAQSEIPFKATAGLHHPIRHWDCAPGVKRHGFLNIAGASVFAQSLGLEVRFGGATRLSPPRTASGPGPSGCSATARAASPSRSETSSSWGCSSSGRSAPSAVAGHRSRVDSPQQPGVGLSTKRDGIGFPLPPPGRVAEREVLNNGATTGRPTGCT